MEEDGTELDEDYFNFINNKTLMVLKGNEAWTPGKHLKICSSVKF